MKTLIAIFIILIGSVCSLQAQNGWKDMGTYKESIDTTGQIQQLKITPDGKYVYCLNTLTEQKKSNLYLQKWSIDSGTIVFSRFIDPTIYTKIYGINLNCDAATYSMVVILKSNPNEYRFIVRDNETDSLLVSIADFNKFSPDYRQIDYDSVFKCFYFAGNSDYFKSSGPDVVKYSNGGIVKIIISGDSLRVEPLVNPNTNKFTHKLGTSVLAVISNYYFQEYKQNIPTNINSNRINYIGYSGNKGINLLEYTMNTLIPFPSYQIETSPNGLFVAATDDKTISTWYIDTTLHSDKLAIYSYFSNSITFPNNKYLIANSPYDSSLKTINIGFRKICGSLKIPFSNLINKITAIPHSPNVLAECTDGKLRLINALKDTLQPEYSFTVDKKRVYQGSPVSFCAVIPSFDSCTIDWKFGDSTTSASFNPRHLYNIPGFYDINMKITDEYGEHIITEKQYIEVLQSNLVMDFEADKSFGIARLTVHFNNKSTGPILSYKWNFDDGTTSIEKDPVHVFSDQRSYSITLTINDGVKEKSYTKYHYINADDYPSFLLKPKLAESYKGSRQQAYKNIDAIHTFVFENMFRSNSGKTFIKLIQYNQYQGYTGSVQTNSCGTETNIYSLLNKGLNKSLFRTFSETREGTKNCTYGNGIYGIISNNSLSCFTDEYYYGDTQYIVNDSTGIHNKVKFPFYMMYYSVQPLKNTIDCYSFRKDRQLISDSSFLCFYSDTNKLLAKDDIKGYALPAVETSTDTYLSVVSPLTLDTNESKKIQLRWYDSGGKFIDSTIIIRPTSDFIYDIIRIPNNRYLMCGMTTLYYTDSDGKLKSTPQGLLLVMNENGTIERTKYLPQWTKLKRITKMDEETFAVTGTPTVRFIGFLAVKSDGTIAGDFRGDIYRAYSNAYAGYDVTACQTCVDVSFGENMNTVFFTRNSGYDAELYVSDNPFLKDINVSVKEESKEQIPSTNSINFAPNPTDGLTTIQYNSTNQQTITITVVSVVGQVLIKQEVQVSAGRNDIPLDVSRFGSGVVFVNISDSTALYHGQLHIIR